MHRNFCIKCKFVELRTSERSGVGLLQLSCRKADGETPAGSGWGVAEQPLQCRGSVTKYERAEEDLAAALPVPFDRQINLHDC